MSSITFSGLASGIDSDSIIEATKTSRRLAGMPFENEITQNTNENSSLEELNTKLLGLRDSLDGFLTLSGGSVSKTASSSKPEAVGISVTSAAKLAGTQISVEQLARGGVLSFADRFPSTEDPIAPNLTSRSSLQITLGKGADAKTSSIDIDSKTTLSTLTNAMNQKLEPDAFASVVNAGTADAPEYFVVINSAKSGVKDAWVDVAVPDEIKSAGVFAQPVIEQAQDAVVNVAGIGKVTRSSNTVKDLFPGVTLELKEAGTGPVFISSRNDVDSTLGKVSEFVDRLNGIISFSKDKSRVETVQGKKSTQLVYGDLAQTRVDEDILSQIKNAISGSSYKAGTSSVNVFADLGITIQRDGTYAVDEKTFRQAMDKDPQAVDSMLSSFSDKVAGASGIIASYTRYQGQIDSSKQANDERTKSLQSRLERLDNSIEQEAQTMRLLYARLESTIGGLNSQASTLTSMLGSLQKAA